MKIFYSLLFICLIFLFISPCDAQTDSKWLGLSSFGGVSGDGANNSTAAGGLTCSGLSATSGIECWAGFDFKVGMLVDVDDQPAILPYVFALEQNYPNPFNPSTKIDYSLAKNSYVAITIFNLLGQTVNSLVNEEQAAGYHSVIWNGYNKFGEETASGIYFYRITAGEYTNVKKMLLLK